MTPWLIFAILTAGALALVLTPLLRTRERARAAAEFDAAVYRDQLREADRDAERGVLSPDEAEAAKAEIARRLLRAADDAGIGAAEGTPGGARRWGAVAAVAIAVPAIALGSYAVIGNPELADRPFAERTDVRPAEAAALAEAPHTMEQAVEQLARRMMDNPLQLDGWLLLGRSYMTMERYGEASEAYRHAVALARGRPEVSASHGEALVAANNGVVSEEAAKAFAFALERNPFDTKSLYYTGLQKAQQGDLRAAVQAWVDLVSVSAPDAPWLPTVREHIARASKEAGIDAASVTPMMNRDNPADDARIREMVGRLENRLKDHPDDEPGWRMLARSYRVLGDDAKAKEAETMADALAETARLERERNRALGGQAPPQQAAPQQVTPEDEQRIRTMVQRLADRLAENPDDEQGWRMLARSYAVLGQPEKAREAQAQADALAATRRQGAAPAPVPSPSQGGQPLQGLSPEEQARARSMVQRLADRLAENPDDEQGWRMLARSYRVLGQADKAAEAEAKANALVGK